MLWTSDAVQSLSTDDRHVVVRTCFQCSSSSSTSSSSLLLLLLRRRFRLVSLRTYGTREYSKSVSHPQGPISDWHRFASHRGLTLQNVSTYVQSSPPHSNGKQEPIIIIQRQWEYIRPVTAPPSTIERSLGCIFCLVLANNNAPHKARGRDLYRRGWEQHRLMAEQFDWNHNYILIKRPICNFQLP